MHDKHSTIKYQEYIKYFEITPSKYIIGIFQPGISVLKQQVRTLNIFDALIHLDRIKKSTDFRIGIVGGGVAGLTFAASALQYGCSIDIIEGTDRFLHLQELCCTRLIHPNIYDWPEEGSLYKEADLPVLPWEYNHSSAVASQIKAEYSRLTIESIRKYPKIRYREFFNAQIEKIDEESGTNIVTFQHSISNQKPKEREFGEYELLILAIGYGTEKWVGQYGHSYWRNDSLDQTRLNKPLTDTVFISGTGDGALMDLFRLAISEFSYDIFLEALNSNKKNASELTKNLSEIRERLYGKETVPGYLFSAFNRIPADIRDYIVKYLRDKSKLRNLDLVLNGLEDFKNILSLNSISFINSFIAYILYKAAVFRYEVGDITFKDDQIQFKGNPINKEWQVILRHGIETTPHVKRLNLSKKDFDTVMRLSDKQKATLGYGTVVKLWDFSKIKRHFNNDAYREIDFVPSRVIDFFTPYVTQLYHTISKLNHSKSIRVTIHRLLQREDEIVFQQITPYCTELGYEKQNLGAVFNLNHGNVGYSMISGKPTLVHRSDEEKFRDLATELKLGELYGKNKKDVKSYITYPILAKIKHDQISTIPNIVIYIDSESDTAFDDSVCNAVFSMSVLLANNINTSHKFMKASISNIEDYLSQRHILPQITNECWLPIEVPHKAFFSELTNFTYFRSI